MSVSYKFYRRPLGGQRFMIGVAVESPAGWRFIPTVSGRRTSLKARETWEACLPRWVDYPDGCESERIEHAVRR